MSVPPSSEALPRRQFVVGGLAGLLSGAACNRRSDSASDSPAVGDTGSPDPSLDPPRRLTRAIFDTFAQCGEDLIMSWLLTKTPLHLERVNYLDIGTHDPIKSNNTYSFYCGGGRGVLMEPNPTLADRLRAERPEDKLLSAGVGIDDTPELDFYMFDDDQLNTFDKEYAERMQRPPASRKLLKVIKVPLLPINRVIAERMGGIAPDALSIDVEGLDLAILRTLDFAKYRPKVICTETLKTTTFDHDPEIGLLLKSKGYELWGRTFANSIFMDGSLIPRK